MITLEEISESLPTGECYMTILVRGDRNPDISYQIELPIAPLAYDTILRAKEVVRKAEDIDAAFRK